MTSCSEKFGSAHGRVRPFEWTARKRFSTKGTWSMATSPSRAWRMLFGLVAILIWAAPLCSDERLKETQHPPVRWMAFHSYLRDLATVKQFGELGIDCVTCFPANTLSSVGYPIVLIHRFGLGQTCTILPYWTSSLRTSSLPTLGQR